jgi:hypothetical protein
MKPFCSLKSMCASRYLENGISVFCGIMRVPVPTWKLHTVYNKQKCVPSVQDIVAFHVNIPRCKYIYIYIYIFTDDTIQFVTLVYLRLHESSLQSLLTMSPDTLMSCLGAVLGSLLSLMLAADSLTDY